MCPSSRSTAPLASRLPALALALSLGPACDSVDDPLPLDRAELQAEDVGVSFRASKKGLGSGSTRLNTATVQGQYDVGSFHRRGLSSLRGPGRRQYEFYSLVLDGEPPYLASEREIRVVEGIAQIESEPPKTLEHMLGSQWKFLAKGTNPEDPANILSVQISGVRIARTPGSKDMPTYNFIWHEDNESDQLCEEIDTITAEQLEPEWEMLIDPDLGKENPFDKRYLGSIFGDIFVGPSGEIVEDPDAIFIGCASGAVIKGGLWGYTPFDRNDDYSVSEEIEELQAVTRVIRADYDADGTHHTEDGTPIQVVDRFDDAFGDSRPFTEAIWGMNGALCGEATPRVPGVGSLVSLVDCMELGFEWIVLGEKNFMWTRHADRETLHKGALQLLADPTCCASQQGPFCATPAVASCVAAYDGYCVDVAWDSLCVQELQWLDCGVCPE